MKRIYLLLIFFTSFTVVGQDNCQIGFVPHSNKIDYNQKSIDSVLEPSKYRAFFLGESHTINFEPEFKFHFIQHLNSEYGVKDVFFEIGFSAAYFFNNYLESGDTGILKNNDLPYLWGHYKDFWNALYHYNKGLPHGQKIVIHGIDFERKEIFKLLEKAIQPGVSIPTYLQKTFADIQVVSANKNLFFGDKEFINAVSALQSAFLQYQNDFKTLYGENYEVIENAIKNELTPNSSLNKRNKIWLEHIQRIITEQQIKKFIGFFGAAHTRYGNESSLTVSLKKINFFKGEILNISTIYKNFISTGGANKIIEYDPKEKLVFDSFYNNNCRAVIIKSSLIPKTGFKTESDYVIFAKEIIDE